jgi:hypothetical protein
MLIAVPLQQWLQECTSCYVMHTLPVLLLEATVGKWEMYCIYKLFVFYCQDSFCTVPIVI